MKTKLIVFALASFAIMPHLAFAKTETNSQQKLYWDSKVDTNNLIDFNSLGGFVRVRDVEYIFAPGFVDALGTKIYTEKSKIDHKIRTPMLIQEAVRNLYVGFQKSTKTIIIYRNTEGIRSIVATVPFSSEKVMQDLENDAKVKFAQANSVAPDDPWKNHLTTYTADKSEIIAGLQVYSHLQSGYISDTTQPNTKFTSFGAETRLDQDTSLFAESSRLTSSLTDSLGSVQTTAVGFRTEVNESTTAAFSVIKSTNTSVFSSSSISPSDTTFMATFTVHPK